MTDAENARLALLIPEASHAFLALRAECQAAGFDIYLGSTLRTIAEQKTAYNTGHSSQTLSWHNIGRGMDCYPIVAATGKPDMAGAHLDLFRKMQQIALDKHTGLSGIAFNADAHGVLTDKRYIHTPKGPVWDGGHFEYRGTFATLADAVKAEGPKFGLA